MKKKKNVKTRARQKEETRILILNTAKKLFLESGYENTTMRGIATAAGIAIGTTFNHFQDKPSLLAATLYQDMETVLQGAYDSQPEDSTLLEMLTHPIRAIYTHFAKTPELSKTWIRETLFMKGYWGEMIDNQFARSIVKIKNILNQYHGELSQEIDCEVLAQGIISHYLSILIYGLKNDLDIESQVAMYTVLIKHQLNCH